MTSDAIEGFLNRSIRGETHGPRCHVRAGEAAASQRPHDKPGAVQEIVLTVIAVVLVVQARVVDVVHCAGEQRGEHFQIGEDALRAKHQSEKP